MKRESKRLIYTLILVFLGHWVSAQNIDVTYRVKLKPNNNVLLSEGAEINTKPQLEIFADDVKCSHGCTVGQLDADALFYLRARGISKKEARALLLYAFANDAMQNIDIEALRAQVSKLLANKLGVDLEVGGLEDE